MVLGYLLKSQLDLQITQSSSSYVTSYWFSIFLKKPIFIWVLKMPSVAAAWRDLLFTTAFGCLGIPVYIYIYVSSFSCPPRVTGDCATRETIRTKHPLFNVQWRRIDDQLPDKTSVVCFDSAASSPNTTNRCRSTSVRHCVVSQVFTRPRCSIENKKSARRYRHRA